jgi:hypothetical protein
MIRNRGLGIAAAVIFACLVGASAGAASVAECKDQIDLISVTGVGNADTATLAHLTSKQEGASLALVQKDFTAAKSALEALRAKVTELSQGSAATISAADAKPLLQDVGRALSCVQSLIDG